MCNFFEFLQRFRLVHSSPLYWLDAIQMKASVIAAGPFFFSSFFSIFPKLLAVRRQRLTRAYSGFVLWPFVESATSAISCHDTFSCVRMLGRGSASDAPQMTLFASETWCVGEMAGGLSGSLASRKRTPAPASTGQFLKFDSNTWNLVRSKLP